MVVPFTCKCEEDPIQNESTRVLTKLYMYIDFTEAQGQVIPQSLVELSWNSNSSKLLLLSSFPVRKKKTQSKMKEIEC